MSLFSLFTFGLSKIFQNMIFLGIVLLVLYCVKVKVLKDSRNVINIIKDQRRFKWLFNLFEFLGTVLIIFGINGILSNKYWYQSFAALFIGCILLYVFIFLIMMYKYMIN